MTNVFFYHLPAGVGSLLPVLVNLMELSLKNDLDTLILAGNREQALPLYQHLGLHFQPGDELSLAEHPRSRHSLCWSDTPGDHHGLLINLTDRLPPWFSRFDCVAELIWGDQRVVERKREHYRVYRHRGYPLQYHDLTGGGYRQVSLL